MNKRKVLFSFVLVVVLMMTCSSLAYAQATRTWVSGVGDDANPCSRTAPCKTFAGAIGKTAAGGEIDVMDPGAFGTVVISKSITIQNEGFFAGVLGSLTSGITVNAGANDVVVIRGLTIEGGGTGLNGIRFLAGGALHIENCTINGFKSTSAGSGNGIAFLPSGASELYIKNTIVRNNGSAAGGGGGILIKPSGAGSAKVVLTDVNIEDSNFGLRADGGVSTGGINVTVKNGSASGNTNAGLLAVTSGTQTQVMVDGTAVSNNGFGVRADGAAATLRFGNTSVTGNGTGMSTANGGQLLSYGNNQVDGNTADGGNPPVIPTK